MSKHTPGPWRWIRGPKYRGQYFGMLVGRDWDDDTYPDASAPGVVMDADPSGDEYAPAIDPDSPDAQLIAAAPELLNACEVALWRLDDTNIRSCYCYPGRPNDPCGFCVGRKLAKVIAKAKGGE